MQNDVSISTNEKDLNIKYGLYNLGSERELARASVKYVLTDMNDIRKSFIRLGYHLSEMQRNRYYQDFGYLTLEEFAAANLGMDKSNVYRYIRVYENFALPGDTFLSAPKMFIDEKWKDYSFSQLVEMSSMTDFQRQACNPDMTIKQIREVKKSVTKDFKSVIDSLSKFLSGDKEQLDQNEKVATSPQKKEDKSKNFSYDYCSGLHGAAQAAYVKSRVAIKDAVIHVYDSNGKRVDLEPAITNIWIDLLYCKEGMYVFRLGWPIEHLQGQDLDQSDRG